jgi:hypothetical protein
MPKPKQAPAPAAPVVSLSDIDGGATPNLSRDHAFENASGAQTLLLMGAMTNDQLERELFPI